MSFARTLDRYRRGDGDRQPFWRGAPPTDLAQIVQQIDCFAPRELRAAVQFLGELKDQGAVTPLVRMLPTVDAELAQHIAQTIATIGGPAACPALLDALVTTRSEPQRLAVVYALTWLLDDTAFPALLRICTNRSEPADVRVQAAEGLTYLADNLPRFSPRWKQAVESLLIGLQDADLEVRYSSIAALGALRVEAAVAPLRLLAESDHALSISRDCSLQQEALDAIDRIQHGYRHPVDAA